LDKIPKWFIGCDAMYEQSDTVLFGAPFDSTASFRPGSRFAPRHMREDSCGLETYSPYQDRDLENTSIFDAGDLELCIGDTRTALAQIEGFVSQLLHEKKRPVMLGGEHLVSLGAIRAMSKQYHDLHIIHFDAHADLRDSYLGTELSHATVIRRVWDILGDGRIYQFGIRSGDRGEFFWAENRVHTQKFNFNGLEDTVNALRGKPIYFTLDLDVLDPSCFPGTGTPEAGGVSFSELLDAVLLLKPLNIVGFDMVELSPPLDHSGVSTATACKLLRELLLLGSV